MGDKHQVPPKPQRTTTKEQPSNHGNNVNVNNVNSSNKGKGNVPTKEDLWKNAQVKTLTNNAGWIVEMTGLSSSTHTVYARAAKTVDFQPSVHTPGPSVREVVESVVDVAWKHVAKHILEAKAKGKEANDDGADDEILRVNLDHWDQGAFPPADQLLELGAVWLVNETSFLQGQAGTKKHPHTKKKRLTNKDDGNKQPDWQDFVLRVHYAPNRFHAMEEVDWAKYCRGLLLGDRSVQVFLKDKVLAAHEHVPLAGYPNMKDGVIVYEDAEHGFAVLNKPGTVPDHATVNNHAEDVLSVFSHVLVEREKLAKMEGKNNKTQNDDPLYNHHHHRAAHLSLPLPLDTETQGLIIIATKRLFGSYLTDLVEHRPLGDKATHKHGVVKKYKCLVCIKSPEDMFTLNNLQEAHAVVTHHYHHNPNHKNHTNFVREIPKNQHLHEYGKCGIRLLTIGTNHGLYAANVTSDTSVGDAHLAQRLWGLGVQNHSKTPAEDLGISYVAQLELEQVVDAIQLHSHLNTASRLTPQQMICGQLAALGFPLVGDAVHGGGTSEVWGHRHGWNRLALQCCEWSFPQPCWRQQTEESSSASNKASSDDGKSCETPDEKKEGKDEGWTTIANGKKCHEKSHEKHHDGDRQKNQAHQQQQHEKRQLLASNEDRCVFRLNEAWWNPLLDQYHVDGF